LWLHEEAAMVCEEIMTPTKAQSALLMALVNKNTTSKLQMKTQKTSKHCTNYGKNNHIVNTCRMKKKKSANYSNNKGYQLELESS
jgi:hypothetical protein